MMKLTDTQHYSDIADAIRAKTGGSGTMTPAEMPTEIANIPSGGGMDEDLEALIEGTASGDIEISLPEQCLGLGLYFKSDINSGVTKLTLKTVKTLGDVSATYAGLMVDRANFTELHLPDCTNLCIQRKSSQSTSTWPELTLFDAPNITSLGVNAFNNAQHLENVVLTNALNIGNAAFASCKLTTVDLPACTSIGTLAFRQNATLDALILRNNAVVTLAGTNALQSTPIESGTGYIYVPRDLVATYQAATNWSTFSAQFRAIEDYTSDGTITGTFVKPA